jgi:sugar lactone lactonase YvrE
VTAEVVADGLMFPEGPRWHYGRLYFSDTFAGLVHSVGEDDSLQVVCEVPQRPSGLGFTPDGELLVVSMLDRRILRLTDDGPVVAFDLAAHALADINDMVVDASGRIYLGNYGSDVDNGEPVRPTHLLRVDPDGRVSVAAEDLVFPNGTVITPDGRTLVVAETLAFRLTAFDVGEDGSLSGRREWARFPGEPDAVLPDGLALDAEGAIWVGDARGSGIARVAEGGEVLARVDTGDLAVYAAALGGADRRTLYMCAAPPVEVGDPENERLGALLKCRVDVPGAGRP